MLKKFFAPQPIPERLLSELPIEMLCPPEALKANSEDQMTTVPSLLDPQMHYDRYPLPVQIIAGSEDQTTDPQAHAKPLYQQLPHAGLRLLPGLGHMVHHFAQDEAAEAINNCSKGRCLHGVSERTDEVVIAMEEHHWRSALGAANRRWSTGHLIVSIASSSVG